MRRPSKHPETGLQCDRLENTCWGHDHTAKDEAGERIFWPAPPPTNAMGRYFREVPAARRTMIQGSEMEEQEIIKAVRWVVGQDILPPMIHVINIKTDPLPEGWIYIGRENRQRHLAESPLHNPWTLQKESDRPELMAKYKRHLWDEMKRRHSPARLELFRLVRLARQGDVHLGCYCKPRDCHGNVIKVDVKPFLLFVS
jgi:hypothetical protein